MDKGLSRLAAWRGWGACEHDGQGKCMAGVANHDESRASAKMVAARFTLGGM